MKKVFLVFEAVLYITFMMMDLLRTGPSNYIKFAAICLIAVSTFRHCEHFTAWAQRLTPLADVFLLLLNSSGCYIAGVLIFFIVQILYTFRLRAVRTEGKGTSKGKAAMGEKNSGIGGKIKTDRSLRRVFTIEGTVFAAGVFRILRRLPEAERTGYILALAALIYIVHFALVNLTGSARNLCRHGVKSDRLFFTGLLLYFICDLFVGIWNLPGGGVVWQELQEIARPAMWGFYLPGQVLIRLSADEGNTNAALCGRSL